MYESGIYIFGTDCGVHAMGEKKVNKLVIKYGGV
jgi:hypothetical protein